MDWTGIIALFIPIGSGVILPIMAIWLGTRLVIKRDQAHAQVLMKALENNSDIDAEKLAAAFSRPRKTPREVMNHRLLMGCIFSLVGAAIGTVFSISCYQGGIDTQALTVFGGIGAILFALGIAYLIVYFVTRKQIKKEE